MAGKPTGSGFRIFRWANGAVHYVTKVSDGSTLNPLVSEFGGWASTLTARVTPDGTRLLFARRGRMSCRIVVWGIRARIVDSGDDAPGCEELFLYDATADGGVGSLVCASCRPGDPQAPASSSASFGSLVNKSRAAATPHLQHPFSDDGRFVFFDTGEALLPSDEDGVVRDVYEYDSVTGELHLLSSGKPASFGATFEDASPSGSDVFFVTRDQLSPWDIDDNMDLYDARVNGGIAAPARRRRRCVDLIRVVRRRRTRPRSWCRAA